jgi:hypothetical protein
MHLAASESGAPPKRDGSENAFVNFFSAGGRRAVLLLSTVLIGVLQSANADEGAPFRIRNLSPLVAIFGLPAWEAPGPRTRVAVTSEVANHYRLSRRGDETLILDGETWRSGLYLRHRFAKRWSASIELPYYVQSGGVLDDLIDSWHSAFGMPDGGRNRRPEDELLFVLENGTELFLLEGRARGLGDAQISFGRAVGSGDGLLLKGTLKLPTGDEDVLAGSGSADLAVSLLRSEELTVWARPSSYFWGVGAAVLGEPDRTIAMFDAKGEALFGMVGGTLRPWPRLGFKAQVDMHTALYDSGLKELGNPGMHVTIGGWWDMTERGALEFAVNEDLSVSTSPDVVFHLALRWSL